MKRSQRSAFSRAGNRCLFNKVGAVELEDPAEAETPVGIPHDNTLDQLDRTKVEKDDNHEEGSSGIKSPRKQRGCNSPVLKRSY